VSKPANSSDAVTTHFDAAIAAIPTCALDEEGTLAQRARYAQLACDVKRLERTGDAVVIEFHDRFDRRTLEETLAVERACCPFFLFRFDERERRLRAAVREPDQLHALDAIANALGTAERARR
jgi:hypothetical protein